MPSLQRDQIFISYSRKDQEIYREVRQKLLDYSLGEHVWDDTEIRLSEHWDDRIQEGMDRAAVAVLILSDHYFARRRGGNEYILEKELPYFIEHYQAGDLDLLLLYWSPSPHFTPDTRDPDRVAPFESSNLPWNLTTFAGETLAEQCGWSFEVRPPGVSVRTPQILSPEPPLLFLFDDRVDGAGGHAGRPAQYLDHTYAFGADI